jgi:hypothetical protein
MKGTGGRRGEKENEEELGENVARYEKGKWDFPGGGGVSHSHRNLHPSN